ncbi:alpha/beta fold hydrolase [Candidatus Peregrinibacteria bacterium]|nr:alpha/beta fold hydrolase [Candidatus Peregrinibacteria bacterium]
MTRRQANVSPFDYTQCDTLTPPLHLLGHSLGGQIAVKLALRGNLHIRHLFLCAPAAIRPRFSVKRVTGYAIAKVGKALFTLPGLHLLQPTFRTILYKLMGVHDYERASSVMQRTMIRVTHEDLTAELPRLSLPVDLFWGTGDRLTPLWKGKRMHTLIAGSSLHTYPSTRHSVHRDRAGEIAVIIDKIINGSKI